MTAPVLALVGPTASGKTPAAVALAEALGAEIASVDSMLVYRGMDVGTAKPTAAERARIPHHLLDLAEPTERFTVSRFQQAGRDVLADVSARRRRVLLAGGSGLYFRAIVDDLVFPPEDAETRAGLERDAEAHGVEAMYRRLEAIDPVAAAKIEPANLRRIVRALEVVQVTGAPFSSFATAWERFPAGRVRVAGVRMPPEVLRARIEDRITSMVAAGWLDEVRQLVARGFGGWLTSTQAIGYAELAEHLAGRLSLDEAVTRTQSRTRNLARRQMSWFRRDPRIRWFDVGPAGAPEAVDAMLEYLETA